LLFFGTFLTHLSSTYIHPPSFLSCVCASLSVRVVLCVSVCLSLFALRVNDYFLKPEHNSFRSTNRSVYRPVPYTFACAPLPIREIRKAMILQCLSVCHSLSVSPPPLPPPPLPPFLPSSLSPSLRVPASFPFSPSRPLSLPQSLSNVYECVQVYSV
jgi:hypothetical protein